MYFICTKSKQKLFNLLFILLFFNFVLPAQAIAQGFSVTPEIWIDAKINTVEKGTVNAVWKKGGDSYTSRGDRVIWGYFHANSQDVSWGSEINPDLFVKIWFDASGRIDVNYFHVSVPDIYVYSSKNGKAVLSGTTTTQARYVRQYFNADGSQNSVTESSPEMVKFGKYSPTFPSLIDELPLATPMAEIHTTEKGIIKGQLSAGGGGATPRKDVVLWGYFYADPTDVTWGNKNNPEVFFKIWLDAPTKRYDVNFFHVSVPNIGVSSFIGYINSNGAVLGFDESTYKESTATLSQRYVRHEYNQ
jgi:hypothetical protein